jgi:hypothetical protein
MATITELIDQTTALLEAVNVKKVTLDASVDMAADSADTATTQAGIATTPMDAGHRGNLREC